MKFYKWNYLIAFLCLVAILMPTCGEKKPPAVTELLIRCDDIGMCHSVNRAALQLAETGRPFSASVMFGCPWYQEAVMLLKDYPQISFGVHLTLNAEWKNYRWGPIVGTLGAPSLVDSCGFFFPSRKLFFENQLEISDVEKELRAQIERAVHSGLKIDYLDYHMGTAVSTPEFRALVERLANEYSLGISRYFGEVDIKNIYDVPYTEKTDSLTARIGRLSREHVNLLVFHIGMDTPEMQAMLDMNPFGPLEMSKHRQAELDALCSRKFRDVLAAGNVKLLNYSDILRRVGLESMRNPEATVY